ncbi:hypothetical protein HispidOSU_027169 [Sigmodon hispidus]
MRLRSCTGYLRGCRGGGVRAAQLELVGVPSLGPAPPAARLRIGPGGGGARSPEVRLTCRGRARNCGRLG